MGQKRGTWVVAAVLLLAVALGAVGLYVRRERGAWLRTPPGREHICVQLEGGPMTALDLEMFEMLLKARLQFMDLPKYELQPVRAEPSTALRPAYFQYALTRRSPGEPDDFTGMFPEFGARPRRVALVDAHGEVVRFEP